MKTIFIIVALIVATGATAQNDIQLSQQSFTRMYYNPAATGQNSGSVFNFLTRTQWTHINEAPLTMLANYQHYFEKYRFSAGINIVNDKLGLENNYNIKGAYSYRIKTGENSFLNLGIGAGVLSKNIDFGRIILEDVESINTINMENSWKPDFDAGLEANWPFLSVGASITHINNSRETSGLLTVPRHYYFYTRGIITLNDQLTLSPAYSLNSCSYRTQHELNLSAFIGNMLFTGLSYRLDESFVILAGIRLNQMFRLNYSYDMNAGAMNNMMSGGSHEILLQINLGGRGNVVQPSPRFFD